MEPCGGCKCSSPEATAYWEYLKNQFEDQTAVLHEKEKEIRGKLAVVDNLISSSKQGNRPSTVPKTSSAVPKVFVQKSDEPVCDLSYESTNITSTSSDKNIPVSFLQRVMENAKSILNLSNNTIRTSMVFPTDSRVNEAPTREYDSCGCPSDSRWPTTANADSSEKVYQAKDSGSKYDSISCSQETTAMMCHACKAYFSSSNIPPTQTSSQMQPSESYASSDSQMPTTTSVTCTQQCSECRKKSSNFQCTTSSCSRECTICRATYGRENQYQSSGSYSCGRDTCDDTQCQDCRSTYEDCTEECTECFSPTYGSTYGYTSGGNTDTDVIAPQSQSQTLSCTCAASTSVEQARAQNVACACNTSRSSSERITCACGPSASERAFSLDERGINTSRQEMHNKNVQFEENAINTPRSTTTPDTISYGTKETEAKQSTCSAATCPSKKYRSRSDIRDKENQINIKESRPPTRNKSAGGVPDREPEDSKCCFHCVQTNEKSDQLIRMMTELQIQEQEIKERMQKLLDRERNYDNALNNAELVHDPYDPNCMCGCREYFDGQNYQEVEIRPPSEPFEDIERVRQELKLENQELKAELIDMKMQLKHTLEKIEGPMKKRLEYEQAKCRKLQQELEETSTTMMLSQDQYGKEMDNLKVQLCCACANMNELNTINSRLKGELNSLDCMCAKLEDDLVKQKLNEAETIKRLAKRSPYSDTGGTCTPCPSTGNYPDGGGGYSAGCPPAAGYPMVGGANRGGGGVYPAGRSLGAPCGGCQDVTRETKDIGCQCDHCKWQEPFTCDSNLHVIARKLSETLRESGPCEECSKLPVELTGAAKVIKDLTDLVESRKEKSREKESACKCGKNKRDSSLHVIARKLSKTLQDTAPCDVCSNLPPDLKDAAKCIKNLTDLVCSRKDDFAGDRKKKDCFCQSLSPMEDTCCQCTTTKDKGIQETKSVKIVDTQAGTAMKPSEAKTETIHPASSSFERKSSSQAVVQDQEAPSNYSTPAPSQIIGEEATSEPVEAPPEGRETAADEPAAAEAGDAEAQRVQEAAEEEVRALTPPPAEPVAQEEITLAVIDPAPEIPPTSEAPSTPPPSAPPPAGIPCGPGAICAAQGMPCVQMMAGLALPVMEAKLPEPEPPTMNEPSMEPAPPAMDEPSMEPAPPTMDEPSMEPEPPAVGEPVLGPETAAVELLQEVVVATEAVHSAPAPVEVAFQEPLAAIPMPPQAIPAEPSRPSDDPRPQTPTTPPEAQVNVCPCPRPPAGFGHVPPGYTPPSGPPLPPTGVAPPGDDVFEPCPRVCGPDAPCAKVGLPCQTGRWPPTKGAIEFTSNVMPVGAEYPQGFRPGIPAGRVEGVARSLGYPAGPGGFGRTGGPEGFGGPGRPGGFGRPKGPGGFKGPGGPEDFGGPGGPVNFERPEGFEGPGSPSGFEGPGGQGPSGPGQFTEKYTGDFPFEVETRAEVLTEPPPGLHVTTTITSSGNLEVITEGPSGVIETILSYNDDGVIEVITYLHEEEETKMPTGSPDVIIEPTSASFTEGLGMDTGTVTLDSTSLDKEKRKPGRLSLEKHRPTAAAQLEFETQRDNLLKIAQAGSFAVSDVSQATDTSGGIEADVSVYSEGPGIGPMSSGPGGSAIDPTTGELRIDPRTGLPEGSGIDPRTRLPGKPRIGPRTLPPTADAGLVRPASDMTDQSTGYPISSDQGMMSSHISTADKSGEPLATKDEEMVSSFIPMEDKEAEGVRKADQEMVSAPISMADKGGESLEMTDEQILSDEIAMAEKGAQPPDTIDEGVISSQIDVADKSSDYPQILEQGMTASQIEMRDMAAAAEGAETSDIDTETSKLDTKDAEAYQELIDQQTSALMYEKESREAGGKEEEEEEGVEVETGMGEGEEGALAEGEQIVGEVTYEKPGEAEAEGEDGEGEGVVVGAAGEGAEGVLAEGTAPEWADLTPITEEGTLEGESKTAGKLAESLEAADAKRQKRDCACQSSPPPIEQSCQCCECKDIGISTSHDSETITEATGDHLDSGAEKESEKSITEETYETESGELLTATEEMAPSSDSKTKDQDKSKRGKGDVDEFKSAQDLVSELIDGAMQYGEARSRTGTEAAKSSASGKGTDSKRSSKTSSRSKGSKTSSKRGSKTSKEEKLMKAESLEGEAEADTEASQTQTTQDVASSIADTGEPVTAVLSSEVPAELRSLDKASRDTAGPDAVKGKTSSASESGPEKRKMKRESDEKKKRGLQEIPKSASQVSSSDGTKPKKRRLSRLDTAVCDCKGVCQCVVCSPEIIRKRLAATGSQEPPGGQYDQLCCCTGSSQVQQQQQMSRPVTPTQQPMYQTPMPQVGYVQCPAPCNYPAAPPATQQLIHPPGCRCRQCRCNPCTPCPPEYESPETFIRSTDLSGAGGSGARPRIGRSRERDRISINDVYQRPGSGGRGGAMSPLPPRQMPYYRYPDQHPCDCECIDCICMPAIKELAQTREVPPIKDEKQVYQVNCICPNAQNARKILAQRSRIPISTNPATSPPRAAVPLGCTCEICKCEDGKKSTPPAGERGGTPAGEGGGATPAPASTKDQCDCNLCECAVCFDKAKSPPGKNEKGCCCKGPCTCEDCPIDKYKKALEKTGGFLPKPGYPSDCNCDKCECPEAPGKPKRKPKPGHPEDCDCEICVCPKGPGKNKPSDCSCDICGCPKGPGKNKPSDCSCDICVCPKGPGKKKPSDCSCDICICPGGGDLGPPQEAVCDCEPCDCDPCADPKKRKARASKPGKIPPCDCPTCECSPCADPNKAGMKPSKVEGCTCETCNCATEDKMTAVPSKTPHPENCDCPECMCMEEILQTTESFGHEDECICEECKCPSDDATSTQHTDGCTCEVCACPERVDTTTSAVHMEGCTCSVCTCPGATEMGVGPTVNAATHPEDCTCEECKCSQAREIEVHPAGCKCAECKCDPCTAAQVHDGNCQCPECQCLECPMGKGVAGKDEKGDAPPAGPAQLINRSCHCLECRCDTCTDPTKVKVEGKEEEQALGPQVATNCTCRTCICIDCAAKERKQGEGDKPSEEPSGETHPDCKCAECTCKPCEPTVPHLDQQGSCQCGDCKCVDCTFKAQKHDGVRFLDQPPGGGKPAGGRHPNCKCEECICVECNPDKAQSVEKKESECKCGDCKCEDCTFKAQHKASAGADQPSGGGKPSGSRHPNCKCLECTCVECKSGEAPSIEKKISECKCGDCKCLECKYKPAAAVSGVKPSGSRHPSCKCNECTCVECNAGDAPSIEKKVSECKCGDCKCVECKYKPAAAALHAPKCTCKECKCDGEKKGGDAVAKGAASVSGGKLSSDRHPNCKCDECTCVECNAGDAPSIEKKVSECKCGDCKCVECKYKPAAATSHAPKCTCKECKCDGEKKGGDAVAKEGDAGGKGGDAGGKGGTVFIDPPPFEPLKRKSCDCNICSCVMCKQKVMTTGEGRTQPATGDAPFFEVPVRLPCSCKVCECPTCNRDAPKPPPSSDVRPPVSGGAGGGGGAAQGGEEGVRPPAYAGDCSCDVCKCPPRVGGGKGGGSVRPPVALQMPVGCDCKVCECGPCPDESKGGRGGAGGGRDPERSSPQAGGGGRVISPSGHPPHCNCPQCSCSPCADEKKRGTGGGKGANGDCNCVVCDCPPAGGCSDGGGSGGERKIMTPSGHPPDCDCPDCSCIPSADASKSGGGKGEVKGHPVGGGIITPSDHPKGCDCAACQCTPCPDPSKRGEDGGGGIIKTSSHPRDCDCAVCQCTPCADPSKHSGVVGAGPGKTDSGDCACCTCKKKGGKKKSPRGEPKGTPSKPVNHPTTCDCPECKCSPCPDDNVKKSEGGSKTVQAAGPSQSSGHPLDCDCYTCFCEKCPDISGGKTTQASTLDPSGKVVSADSGVSNLSKVSHPNDCDCPECCMSAIGTMDNATLMQKIETDKRKNCECREQIKEIKKALTKIKCACTEAEMKAVKSSQVTTQGVGRVANPLIKQASTFGQTMSGLKMALNNLQDKCKAKDKLIQAMTGELKTRISSKTLDNIIAAQNCEAPDFDKGGDVKSLEPSTNVLYTVNEENTDFDAKLSKAVATEKHKQKRRTKSCKCGKSHKDKEKDSNQVDLTGFEVIDIRRITNDSIIIKWKPPRTNLVTGYDIFVNGVNKSKVMSGGRTSAMVHSLDLSSTIQITIYAVTKCGRCEPPAIAIYEIK